VKLRIVSGGQSGVDRAALDVSLELGIDCGGWCPCGRRAEDGAIPERYPLVETPSRRYSERTEWNVRDSDATLVLARAPLRGGTLLTRRLARRLGKPVLVVDPSARGAGGVAEVARWIEEHRVRVLNVAGPRESGCPGIHAEATRFLRALLSGG
jgi:hypothetical protein